MSRFLTAIPVIFLQDAATGSQGPYIKAAITALREMCTKIFALSNRHCQQMEMITIQVGSDGKFDLLDQYGCWLEALKHQVMRGIAPLKSVSMK
jgi:hypothetical protein